MRPIPKREDYMHEDLKSIVKQPQYSVALEQWAEEAEKEIEILTISLYKEGCCIDCGGKLDVDCVQMEYKGKIISCCKKCKGKYINPTSK